ATGDHDGAGADRDRRELRSLSRLDPQPGLSLVRHPVRDDPAPHIHAGQEVDGQPGEEPVYELRLLRGGRAHHRPQRLLARADAVREPLDPKLFPIHGEERAASAGWGVVKLGVSVGYWGLGLTAADQLDIAQTAEKLGYDSIWTAEAYGSDAATVLAWLAAGTSRIKLGAGIFQIPGRSAAMTAMTAATIDNLSGGRMILGLGTSGPQVSEGFHGVRFGKQLQRTREYVAVVRMALARQKLEYHGETLELPLPDGPGKALKLTIRPVQEQIPIFLAVLGPKNVALADELIDLLSIVGPRDRVKEKLRAFGDAGIDTLIVWPVMPDHGERKEQLRQIAELAQEVG